MAKNLLASVGNTKTRTFVLFLAVVLIIAVLIIFFRSSSEVDPLKEKMSSTTAIPSSIKAVPGNETPEKFRQLQMEDNRRRVLEAYEKKTNAMPTIVGVASTKDFAAKIDEINNMGDANASEMFGDTQRGGFVGKAGFQTKTEKKEATQSRDEKIKKDRERINKIKEEREQQRAADRARKEAAQDQARYIDSIKQTTKSMQKHASSIFSNWTKFTEQAYFEGALAKGDGKDDKNGKNQPFNLSPGGNSANGTDANGNPIGKSKEFIKAGSVLFGVIETAVNTDEASPIMATIVSGKYRGGKLIGKIQHKPRAEKVILSFEVLSLPNHQKSIAIKAVAIDPDTARTALASDVDHHYLLRYGSLFASAFMDGYGQAITDAGSTNISSPTGTITTTKTDLSGSEQIYAAFGEVGKKWSKQAEKIFDTPYTVTVDQGIGVGILFLSDVDVSAPPAPVKPDAGNTDANTSTNTLSSASN
jgi:hypothetical protein